MITPTGPVMSCIKVQKISAFLGGGTIWRPYVSFVACVYCGMVMVYVLVGSSPNFCGIVVNMHNVGSESFLGRAFLQALRSLLMLIS